MAAPNLLPFVPGPPEDDLLEAIRQRRAERFAQQSQAYARSVPIASDIDPASCLRRQVLEVVAWSDKRLPDPSRQARFDAGNRAEDAIVIDLKRDGFRVVAEQVPFELKHRKTGEVALRGKIDGKIEWRREAVPFEIKSAHPNIFEAINSVEDFERFWWTKGKYPAQLHSYLVGHNHPWGFWILTDCLGNLKLLRAELDYSLAERIWAFAEAIVDGIRAYRESQTLPPPTSDVAQCAHCDFYRRTCQPDIVEQGAAMLADPELEAAVARWFELRPAHREYEGVDRRVKSALRLALPQQPIAMGIVGGYAVTIKDKPVRAETQPRPARTDRIVTIDPLAGDAAKGGEAL